MSTISNEAILSFQLDDPKAGLKFSERLARENNWSAEYTAMARTEYKRFLVLCADGRHPMTPSDVVDQVWHMHLCYTDSYWNDLCGSVLGKPLHHGPTKGGDAERSKYHNWYEKTLLAYVEIFGESPPSEIWPATKVRFARQDFKRVDVSSHFVIPKKLALLSVIGGSAAIILASCSTVLATTDSYDGGLIVLAIPLVIGLLIFLFKGGGKGGNGGGCGGSWSGCGGDSGCGGGGGCGSGCGGG